MGNLKVTMTDVNGVSKTFDGVEEGTSLMELGKQNDVAGIMGDCGGGCACATCHVYVNGDWFAKVGEPDDIASGVLYLSSKAGQYVTGKLLEIDGGIQQPTLDLGFPDLV